MAGRLEGQVGLVTGGASGIGRATVLALAAEGVCVAVVDRDAGGAAAVATEAAAAQVSARPFVADLAGPGTIPPLVQGVLAEFGRIDILVNSAGVSGPLEDSLGFSDETMELVLSVNLKAPMLLIRAVGNHMVERGGGGRIVNLSSSAAFRSTLSPVAYATTKAAINGLTRVAAGDLGRHGINVNAVAPGLTKTPMTADVGDDESYQRAASSGPLANLLRRPSEAHDVANTIVFLCLPESRQITGQVIHTSAGQVV